MKPRGSLLQNQVPSVTFKQAFFMATAFMGVTSLAVWVAFVFFNVGAVMNNTATAATPTRTAKTGNWHAPGTWSPVGVPGDNEIILIPSGVSVTVLGTDHILNQSILVVEGRLRMESTCGLCADYGSLTFIGPSSGVIIENGGRVTDETLFGGDTHFISAQGTTFWSGNDCTSNCGSVVGNFTSSGVTAWPSSLINPLPVEISFLKAAYEDKKVKLEWATLTEKNNSHFEVERSIDGREFLTIGVVKGSGTSTETVTYTYVDRDHLLVTYNRVYYRLKQIDYDERSEYTEIVSAENNHVRQYVPEENLLGLAVSVFPNPVQGRELTIQLDKPVDGRVIIVDDRGHQVFTQVLNTSREKHPLVLHDDLNPGVYIVNFESPLGRGSTKIIKQ